MGCDIHLHIELKIDDVWHHFGAPSVRRDYHLFEKLAGVRGSESVAITPPKGLPSDCSLITQKAAEYWEEDGHSTSWLGVDEIMILEDWLGSLPTSDNAQFMHNDLEYSILHTYLQGNSFTGWKRYPEDDRPYDVEDVRFVFWFDN